jgi:hypothetical protein
MDDFSTSHDSWIKEHLERRSGERRRRLQEGHGHAEKLFLELIWWPAVGHFRALHPEYEVKDFQDGSRFIDFAYVRQPYRIAMEIDGFGPHLRDVDRTRFGDNLMRQNQLVLDGWKIIRFSYDDIINKQRRCQQVILQMRGRWFGEHEPAIPLLGRELDIVRLAAGMLEPVTPAQVAAHLGIRPEHARRWLHRLQSKNIVRSAGGSVRIRSYVLTEAGKLLFV